jgi:hypothetical protein
MADIGEFSMKSAMGTPLAMYGNPGMMRMMLPQVIGLPNGLLDETRSAHMLVSFPDKGQPPKFGFYIPTNSQDGLEDKLKGMGYKSSKGGWEKKKGMRRTVFLLPAKGGLIMHEYKKNAPKDSHVESAQWVKTTLEGWKNLPKLHSGLKVVAKVKDFLDQNEELVNFSLAMMFSQMEREMKNEPEMAIFEPFLKAYKDSLPLWLKQMDEVHYEMNINGEGINLSHVLLAPKGSHLTNIAKNWAADKTPAPAYAGSMPLNAVTTATGSLYKDFGKDLKPLILPVLTSLNKVMGTKKLDWVKWFDQAIKYPTTQFASSTVADPVSGFPVNLSVQTLTDPKKSVAMMDELFEGLNGINDLIPKDKGKKPLTLNFSADQGKQKVEGLDTKVYSMFIIPGKGLPPMATAQMTKSNFKLTTLTKGKEFYSAQGAPKVNTTKILGDLVKAAPKGNQHIGNKTSWKQSQAKASGSKVVASMYMIDLIKLAFAAEADTFKNLPMPMDIGSMLDSLPNSSVPISMDLKALNNGFDFTVDLPSGAIQEIVTAVMQSLMNMNAPRK